MLYLTYLRYSRKVVSLKMHYLEVKVEEIMYLSNQNINYIDIYQGLEAQIKH